MTVIRRSTRTASCWGHWWRWLWSTSRWWWSWSWMRRRCCSCRSERWSRWKRWTWCRGLGWSTWGSPGRPSRRPWPRQPDWLIARPHFVTWISQVKVSSLLTWLDFVLFAHNTFDSKVGLFAWFKMYVSRLKYPSKLYYILIWLVILFLKYPKLSILSKLQMQWCKFRNPKERKSSYEYKAILLEATSSQT